MTKSMKRIHKVVLKRLYDESPDTSWLGEYGQRAESKYAIDRRHKPDCQSLEHNHIDPLNQLERAISYLNTQTYESEHSRACAHSFLPSAECTCGLFEQNESIQDAQNLLIGAQEDLQECNCGGVWIEHNSCKFFNPCHENYKGLPEDEIRKYCQQDYERMESLHRGDWAFIGIRAEAEWSITQTEYARNGSLIQTVTSGGLWGIESDSSPEYLKETEQEQLSELRGQLRAIGFSSRAISAAFKNIETEVL